MKQFKKYVEMSSLRSVWLWCFHVSNPKDPKLRGWLHPAFALMLNLGLAYVIAFAAFLAAPSSFHQEWLQLQPAAVVQAVHGVQQVLAQPNYVGVCIMPSLLWLKGILGSALLHEKALFDSKQAFALYSWEGASVYPQYLAGFLLIYVALMVSCRVYEKGPMMLYDMAWACNLSMVLTATAIWLNIPFLVSACSCWVAVDQLLWYADLLSLLFRGRVLIGVAKYVVNKDTPWTKKIFSTHHVWFIPFTTYINLKYAAGHSPCCLSVSLALSIACVLGSRCCTPYEIHFPGAPPNSNEPSRRKLYSDLDNYEKEGHKAIMNVNVSWRCWADVAHHVPILGIFDGKAWYLFVIWNQLVWGLGNCFFFGIFLGVANLFRTDY